MLGLLQKMCKENKIIAIYTDPLNTTKFIYGEILYVDESDTVIHMIDLDGNDDGMCSIKTNKIFRVSSDGQYDDKIKKLFSKENYQNYALNKYLNGNYNIPETLLFFAKENVTIVSVELLDSGYDDVVGFVDFIDNGICKIKQIDEYGFEDGYSYVCSREITQVSCFSSFEKRILRLFNENIRQGTVSVKPKAEKTAKKAH